MSIAWERRAAHPLAPPTASAAATNTPSANASAPAKKSGPSSSKTSSASTSPPHTDKAAPGSEEMGPHIMTSEVKAVLMSLGKLVECLGGTGPAGQGSLGGSRGGPAAKAPTKPWRWLPELTQGEVQQLQVRTREEQGLWGPVLACKGTILNGACSRWTRS